MVPFFDEAVQLIWMRLSWCRPYDVRGDMFQSRFGLVLLLLIVLCGGLGGGVIYLGRAQPPVPVMVHHVIAAPQQAAPAGGVSLPDVVPGKP